MIVVTFQGDRRDTINYSCHPFSESQFERYKNSLVPFNEGWMVTTEIGKEPNIIAAGSLVINHRLASKLPGHFHITKPSELLKTLAIPNAAAFLSTQCDTPTSIYFNRASGYIVNYTNDLIQGLTAKGELTKEILSDADQAFDLEIKETLRNSRSGVIDTNAQRLETYFTAALGGDIPSFIRQRDIVIDDDMQRAITSIIAAVFDDDHLITELIETNPYFDANVAKQLAQSMDKEQPYQGHVLLPDNKDVFPSYRTLQAVHKQLSKIPKDAVELRELYRNTITKIAHKVCTAYIFAEIIDAICLKKAKPDTLLVTKYTTAQVYTENIKATISLVAAAMNNTLSELIRLIKKHNVKRLFSETIQPGIQAELSCLFKSDKTPSIYKAYLTELGLPTLYSHQLETSKYKKGKPTSTKIKPNPFTDSRGPKGITLMVCYHEAYATKTVEVVKPPISDSRREGPQELGLSLVQTAVLRGASAGAHVDDESGYSSSGSGSGSPEFYCPVAYKSSTALTAGGT